MADPLMEVPGLAGYISAQQQNQAQTAGQLQNAAAALTLQGALAQQAREQSFRREMAQTDGSADAAMSVASRYANPHDLLTLYVQDRQRRDLAADRMLQFAQTMQARQDALDERKRQFDQNVQDRAARDRFEQDYRNASLENQRQAATLQAQLRTMGLELTRQGQALQLQRFDQQKAQRNQQQVQQLGTALERAGLPETDATIRAVEDSLNKRPDLAEYLSGPKSLLPDVAVPEDIRAGRQAFQKLFNIEIKSRSGSAVTSNELERLKSEFGSGAFKTPDQLRGAVNQARNIFSQHYRSVASSFGPEALAAYNDNMRQLGGTPLLEAPAQLAPAPTGAASNIPAPPPGFKLN
jgi:hypothetical protein